MNRLSRSLTQFFLLGGVIALATLTLSCGNIDRILGTIQPKDICDCLAIEPDITDYRHNAKHVPIPNIAAEEITVEMILSWREDLALPPDAPRTGRELRVFHVAGAFVQNASVNPKDCDIHIEISQTADKNARRIVVETPIDSGYCPGRKTIQAQLLQHGFQLDVQHGGELLQALRAEILGMAFEDFEHDRGSPQVGTVWELHPATVNLLP
ncbi:MAG TPA: hypothetical protein VOA41_05805 [Candidatus Dormibacteraeota bacterium]|nr:hypothetical protein [Candidatus Dormibacteraeota bacterium]